MDQAPKSLSDPNHPLWSFLRTAMVLVAFLAFLRSSAANFDSTEIRDWMTLALLAFGAQGGHEFLKSRKNKKDASDASA